MSLAIRRFQPVTGQPLEANNYPSFPAIHQRWQPIAIELWIMWSISLKYLDVSGIFAQHFPEFAS